MHALVFRITIHNPEEADRPLNEQFVAGARRAPGSEPAGGSNSRQTVAPR
jgi:hypothetical protein